MERDLPSLRRRAAVGFGYVEETRAAAAGDLGRRAHLEALDGRAVPSAAWRLGERVEELIVAVLDHAFEGGLGRLAQELVAGCAVRAYPRIELRESIVLDLRHPRLDAVGGFEAYFDIAGFLCFGGRNSGAEERLVLRKDELEDMTIARPHIRD